MKYFTFSELFLIKLPLDKEIQWLHFISTSATVSIAILKNKEVQKLFLKIEERFL